MDNHEKFDSLNISSQNPNYSQNENYVKSVSDEIERGAVLYEERQLAKKHVHLEPLYKTAKGKNLQKAISPFSVYKYYCSRNDENYFQRACEQRSQCKHYGNVIINRDIMTSTEHLNFLARPKFINTRRYGYGYCPPQQQNCYYVKRYPLSASSRIEQLSVPPEKYIINTWLQYGNIFTTRQITNLANLLIASKHTNIAKAVDNIIEDKKLKKVNKLRCLKEAAKIKRKINILKGEHVRQIMCSVTEILRDFLMEEHNDTDSEQDLQTESLVILKYLANMLCINTPSFESDNLLDRFLINLSKNIAVLINDFLRNAGLNTYFDYCDVEYPTCEEARKGSLSSIGKMQKNICDEIIMEEDEDGEGNSGSEGEDEMRNERNEEETDAAAESEYDKQKRFENFLNPEAKDPSVNIQEE